MTDEKWKFNVTFPDFPECITFGNSIEHALEMAKDALKLVVGYYIDENIPLPDPSQMLDDRNRVFLIECK
ncbi:type II toxin-antitoxin system HicB family antitoxin [Sedimentibacter sp. zth1]|uniref:type II toxin-antitoxin system HicB family antitoxin n=1 Tax=Sedimentibacter sp. zth1 TaxID=2816908 RepID=UPI001A9248C8|nr:type II toxin-antitoxin system HicB family antitoxin [Sedimentibacter sp. zth1]